MKHLYRLTSVMILFICAAWIQLHASTSEWKPDVLGRGYEMREVDQGRDYSGPVVSTVVRRLAPDSASVRRAVLYVHGFNDYFFNAPMGEEFNSHGYDFYAVDLRKYGRSIRKGQRMFQVLSIDEYYPDIDSALVIIRQSGVNEIVLMGHSTGGLVTACYMNDNPSAPVDALVLNSPFLDWNLGWKERLVPLISWWGLIAPDTRIPQGDSTAYAESLLKSCHGDWEYDTHWKLMRSPDVTAGWVRAIDMAQRSLRNGKAHIRVPILLMYSSQSVYGDKWNEEHNNGDGVLDVDDIRKYGVTLGPHVTCMKVVGGLHDLLLSNQRLLAALYPRIFLWLAQHLPPLETAPAQPVSAGDDAGSGETAAAA